MAVVAGELLREAAVRGRVLLDDIEEAVGVCSDGLGGGVVGLRTLGIAPGRRGRIKVLEEGERGGGDVEMAESIDLVESVVELFGCREGGEIPVACRWFG